MNHDPHNHNDRHMRAAVKRLAKAPGSTVTESVTKASSAVGGERKGVQGNRTPSETKRPRATIVSDYSRLRWQVINCPLIANYIERSE